MTFPHSQNLSRTPSRAAAHLPHHPPVALALNYPVKSPSSKHTICPLLTAVAVSQQNHHNASQANDRQGPNPQRAQLRLQHHFSLYQQGEPEYRHCCGNVRCKITLAQMGSRQIHTLGGAPMRPERGRNEQTASSRTKCLRLDRTARSYLPTQQLGRDPSARVNETKPRRTQKRDLHCCRRISLGMASI